MPSYQVTRQEQHSTRGRAHLLWEMLQGDVITDGWRSIEVRDALDLCLSCKGCLSDCPVNVDMASYKAEFTHHHYAGRPWARPRSPWSMGWLPVLARAASRAPRLTNVTTGSRAAVALKRLGGIAAERDIPRFADVTFRSWFESRTVVPAGESTAQYSTAPHGQIMLWPDTFTNFLTPHVGRSAVRVLEDAGFEVLLPAGSVCCGLTWASTGQLGVAKRVLARSLTVLRPAIEAGIPRSGAELHGDAPPRRPGSARRRSSSRGDRRPACRLREHLRRGAGEPRAGVAAAAREPKRIGTAALRIGTAALPSACRDGFRRRYQVDGLARIDVTVPDSGCCGLAGNFGFEPGHYEVSMAAGERVLLPAVRGAEPGTEILADGFSCRTQIAHGTNRTARHLAELLADGLDRGD